MAIQVTHGNDRVTNHDGGRWHIDEDGRLHIIKNAQHIAAYHADAWANVRKVDDDTDD